MRPRIPDITREAVIERWLNGRSRKEISDEFGVSGGGISGIIAEWINSTGKDVAIQLRDLSLAMRKSGISIPECARGFRIEKLMSQAGVSEDELGSFLVETFNRCKSIDGFNPQFVAYCIKELISLSAGVGAPGLISISQIPAYLDQMKSKSIESKQEIDALQDQISNLKSKGTSAKEQLDFELEDQRITRDGLNWYTRIRDELLKYDIPVDEMQKLLKTIRLIRNLRYNPNEIVNRFSNYELMRSVEKELRKETDDLENNIKKLQEEKAALEERIAEQRLTLNELEGLRKIGVGYQEIRKLRMVLKEIARANRISTSANISDWQKLFQDIESQYDMMTGFEIKIRKQQLLLEQLVLLTSRLLAELGDLVVHAIRNGIRPINEDLMKTILEKYPHLIEQCGGGILQRKNENTTETGRNVGNEKHPSSSHISLADGDIVG